MATLSIHYDGPITDEHRLSVRVMAKTYEHAQRAIDRAFLVERYGDVWKHARLKKAQYAETKFLAEYPKEGGIILDMVRVGAGPIVDRIAAAIRPVYEEAAKDGLKQLASLDEQLKERVA